MKILLHETSFTVTANMDERLKQRKDKMLVHSPTIFVIRPKPSGVILNARVNTTVYKRDAVDGVILKASKQTSVYKQNP